MEVFETLSRSPKGAFILIDFSLVLLAVITNCIVLVGIIKGRFKLAGYRRFLLSLCIGDLYMCCVNFTILTYDAATRYQSKSDFFFHFFRGLQLIGFFANLFNLCGVSADHFVGIIYPHKYRYLSKKFVARYATVYLWIFATILGLSDVPKAIFTHMKSDGQMADNVFLQNTKHYPRDSDYSTDEADAECAEAINIFANAVSGVDPNSFKELYELISIYLSDQNSSEMITPKTLGSQMVSFKKRSAAFAKGSFSTTELPSTTVANYSTSVDLVTEVPIRSTMNAPRPNRPCFTGNISRTEKVFDEAFNSKRLIDLQRFNSDPNLEYIVIVVCFLCFLFLILCYGIIFKKIFDSKRDQPTAKLIATSCLFVGSFVICWLPFITFEILLIVLTQFVNLSAEKWTNLYNLHEIFMSILMSYPLCDSVIYGVRVPAIRRLFLTKFQPRQLAANDYYYGGNSNIYHHSYGGNSNADFPSQQTPNRRSRIVHSIALTSSPTKRLPFIQQIASNNDSVIDNNLSPGCSLVVPHHDPFSM